jgi:hypothetical protein
LVVFWSFDGERKMWDLDFSNTYWGNDKKFNFPPKIAKKRRRRINEHDLMICVRVFFSMFCEVSGLAIILKRT